MKNVKKRREDHRLFEEIKTKAGHRPLVNPMWASGFLCLVPRSSGNHYSVIHSSRICCILTINYPFCVSLYACACV